MISHQSQSTPITGYFEYLSRIRQRVNVTPYEAADSEETTTTTTTITSPSVALVMDNDNTVSATDSSPADNLEQQIVNVLDKDTTKWSSAEVQQWIEEQCEKFELKKAIAEKFQLNGTIHIVLKSCVDYFIEHLLFI
jgi:glutamyl/glutaminyl-tRNA synthetase